MIELRKKMIRTMELRNLSMHSKKKPTQCGIIKRFLPYPRIMHPYPEQRLRVLPKAEALCGNSVCWDLSRVRRATGVPTDIHENTLLKIGLHPFLDSQRDSWGNVGGVYPLGCNGPLPTRLKMFRIPSAKA